MFSGRGMKKIVLGGLFAALVLALWPHRPAAQPAAPASGCGPVGQLSFICGMQHPEDLAQIPGTRFLIASGFTQGAGLKLVDTDAKSMHVWYQGEARQIAPDTKLYGACPGAPDAKIFNAHGINLKPKGDGRYTLYVVNHGGRQSIEIFTVAAVAPEPSLTWNGCVLMPEGTDANGVSAYKDGTMIATVQLLNGKTLADSVNGIPTGGVFEWKPGSAGFRLLPGTAVPGNNGIEVGRNDREFYLIGFGVHTIYVFDRNDTQKPLRQTVAPGFMPDNLHWDGDRLIAAGMMFDEPACGGVRKVVDGKADPLRCPRGWMAGALDPEKMTWSIVAYGIPNPVFNGVSAATVQGGNIWLGNYQSDRLAYLPIPHPLGPAP